MGLNAAVLLQPDSAPIKGNPLASGGGGNLFSAVLRQQQADLARAAFLALNNPSARSTDPSCINAGTTPRVRAAVDSLARPLVVGASFASDRRAMAEPGQSLPTHDPGLPAAAAGPVSNVPVTALQLRLASVAVRHTNSLEQGAPGLERAVVTPDYKALRAFRLYRLSGGGWGVALRVAPVLAGLWNDPAAMVILGHALRAGVRPQVLLAAGHPLFLYKE